MKSIAIALALFLSASVGFSQCLMKSISANKEMHASSFVIIGTVTSAHAVPEAWDFLDGMDYTVHVDRVLHGHPDRAMYTIFSENIPNSFKMTPGMHYVLYVHPKYDRYEVSNCGNSHPTSEMEASTGKPFTPPDHGVVGTMLASSTHYLFGY